MPPQIVFLKVSKSQSIPLKIFINKSNHVSPNSTQTTTTTKSLAINAKSLITLQNVPINYFHIRLSNNYLQSLIETQIRDVFVKVLFEMGLDQVCSVGISGKVSISSILRFNSTSAVFTNPLETSNTTEKGEKKVRYKFTIPLLLIISLRIHFNKLSKGDITYLHGINILSSTNPSFKLIKPENQFSLLVKKQSFKEIPIEEDDIQDEPVVLVEDDDLMVVPDDEVNDKEDGDEEDEGDTKGIDDKKSLHYKYRRIQIFNSIAHSIKLYIIES
ncbi:single strand annealing-weakened 1 [Scheffersomyces coipomensis]|uniref:single strand annealing-weakened 1 n=1 Tax=Scheffersomyces coipomensis TaxID=1788519 RepID=UPI00315D0742